MTLNLNLKTKMKKIVLVLLLVLPISLFSRSFHCSSHAFHSSRPSTHSFSGHSVTRTVSPSIHTNSIRTTSIKPITGATGFKTTTVIKTTPTKNTSYFHNSPSYGLSGGSYHPIYHYNNNLLFWYFITRNNRTHRNDTIKAKSKSELDLKVKQSNQK